MSLSLFIARRIYRESDSGKQVSRPAVLIAMAGIAIGLAVMIIAVAVVIGFKSEVRNEEEKGYFTYHDVYIFYFILSLSQAKI